jgi:hypothetical protein
MPPPNFPNRKISETLLDFAEPILAFLGPQASQAELTQALEIAVTIWNAIVLDAVENSSKNLEMVRDALGSHRLENPIIQTLVDRKRRFFADDMRGISDFQVSMKNDGLVLRAEARNPYSSRG